MRSLTFKNDKLRQEKICFAVDNTKTIVSIVKIMTKVNFNQHPSIYDYLWGIPHVECFLNRITEKVVNYFQLQVVR